jgi:hypothetical protein
VRMETKISWDGSLEFIRGLYNMNQAHKSWKKNRYIRWTRDIKTPAPSKMRALFFPAITWNTTKNVTTIESPAEQTAFRIQHSSSTVTLKYFGMCVKNKYRHFTTVYNWCTCHWVGYNNDSSYLQLFVIN